MSALRLNLARRLAAWSSLVGASALLLGIAGCGSRAGKPVDAGGERPAADGSGADAPADMASPGDTTPTGDVPGPVDAPESDVDAAPPSADSSDAPPEASAPSDATDSDARDTTDGDARDAGVTETPSRAAACTRSYMFDWKDGLPSSHTGGASPFVPLNGSPSVDTTANELLLPYDSRVFSTAVSPTEYVLEFDLAIDGDLTFLVEEDGSDIVAVPSITRSGNELVLGTASYGTTATSSTGGGFTGQRIPAGPVHVTVYVSPSFHLIALKVDAGQQSFWSGFIVVNYNPQGLRLIGDNLPAERGTTARAHVGVITGCDRSHGFGLGCGNFRPGQWCQVDAGAPF